MKLRLGFLVPELYLASGGYLTHTFNSVTLRGYL